MFLLSTLIFFLSIPAFLVGMAAPRVYSRFFKKGVTRGKIAAVLGVVLVTSLVVSVTSAPPVEPKPEAEATTEENKEEASADLAPVSDTDSDQAVATEAQTNDTGKVVKVVDGDTLTVEINGINETIRIIGINTPETVDPRKPVECFGQEASAKAKELLDGQTVHLEADATQGERDKYNRLLRYVFLSDDSDFGKRMISEGYAYEYTYSTQYKYQQDYKTAQTEAQAAKRGLWADGACEDVQEDASASGGATTTTETEASTPTVETEPSSTSETTPSATDDTSSTPTDDPEPTTAPSTTTASCSCPSNDLDCGDFATHAEAQAIHDCCMDQVGYDVHRLDGSDNDGQACESLP